MPCFSDTYLPTFNRDNVTLVDTAGRGVEWITHNALVADGQEYAIDCLVYSTGFDVGAPFAKRIGYPVLGNDKVALTQKCEKGAATQHGIAANGFPNMFLMSTVQTGLSLNFAHMIDEQARHIAYSLGRAIDEVRTRLEVTQEAQDAWVAEIDRTAVSQEEFQRACTPSYFNAEGDVKRFNHRNSTYGGGPMEFYAILVAWRAEGSMARYSIS